MHVVLINIEGCTCGMHELGKVILGSRYHMYNGVDFTPGSTVMR